MHVIPVSTPLITTQDQLCNVVDAALPVVSEGDIVAITSKVLSILQGRLVPIADIPKKDLIAQEADWLLETDWHPYGVHLTLKNGLLIASAGIDESNSQEAYILYPLHIQETATQLWQHLRQRHNLQHVGVVITDSHTTVMRRGVTGIALGWCGFQALHSYVGKPDLFGKPLRVTQLNVLDAVASAAVFVMGEGNEQTPLALIQEAPKVTFQDNPPTAEEVAQVTVPLDQDLYAPLLNLGKWVQKKD